jgi:hypothetical protein
MVVCHTPLLPFRCFLLEVACLVRQIGPSIASSLIDFFDPSSSTAGHRKLASTMSNSITSSDTKIHLNT